MFREDRPHVERIDLRLVHDHPLAQQSWTGTVSLVACFDAPGPVRKSGELRDATEVREKMPGRKAANERQDSQGDESCKNLSIADQELAKLRATVVLAG